MTTLKFELTPHVLHFERGSSYPTSNRDEIMQAHDRTAAGNLKAENYGVKVGQITLEFIKMSRTDYTALKNWFLNISVGAMNKFTVTDEYGEVYEAKIVSRFIVFPEVQLDHFSGNILIEKV